MNGTKRRLIGAAGVVAALAVAGGAARGGIEANGARAGGEGGIAALQDTTGNTVGRVTFTREGGAVRVQAEAYGLPPGFHGFHVHATGACDPTTASAFTSAGGHLDAAGHGHGHHAGDMPVLYIKEDGSGSLAFLADAFTIADLLDADGSAVIVHANPDNYANIPTRYAPAPDAMTLGTGDAGGRIACGAVQAVAATTR